MVRLVTGCGGGVGLPEMRNPHDVLKDVMNDLLTLKDARNVYKVSINADTLQINHTQTARLRQK